MANIATALKDEIARVARKEIRVETESMKKAISSIRTEIAAIKERKQALDRRFATSTRRIRSLRPSRRAKKLRSANFASASRDWQRNERGWLYPRTTAAGL